MDLLAAHYFLASSQTPTSPDWNYYLATAIGAGIGYAAYGLISKSRSRSKFAKDFALAAVFAVLLMFVLHPFLRCASPLGRMNPLPSLRTGAGRA